VVARFVPKSHMALLRADNPPFINISQVVSAGTNPDAQRVRL